MYKIKVKKYMTQKASAGFDFMLKWNNDVPMPLRIMVGEKLEETRGMIKMRLHGDITEEQTQYCMKCGRPITNNVSKFFGMGPECGQHAYTNPFDTEEELKQAVSEYRERLRQIEWEGWIIKSAIEEEINLDESTEIVAELNKTSKNAVEIKEMNISIAKSKNCFTDESAYLSFKYDNKALAIIKSIMGRYWHTDDKVWEIPADKVDYLMKSLPDYKFNINGELPKKEKSVAHIPDGFKFKTEPFEHQIDGFNYGLEIDRWLLGDEQGLGKTKQVIDIAVAKKLQKGYKHCLIVCGVNGLKWNWQREVAIHSDESAWILGQKFNKSGKINIGSTNDKLNDLNNIDKIDSYFIITNVESLRDANISAKIAELCNAKVFGVVAIDEIHKCKNPSSQQGKGILKVQSECRIAMTGTPLMNTPMDLYIILKWLGYEKHPFYAFKKHYCVMGGYGGYEIVGYKNLDELQANLNSIMLRRLKAEVLDLPEKLYIDEFVEMTAKQAVVYKEVSAEIKSNIDMIKCANNPLAELIRLRQATGYTGILSSSICESAKLDRMEELIEEATDNGKKVVVFSNWLQITEPTVNRLQKYRPIVITGETKDNERQFLVRQFQDDPNTKVAIGTIGAMGTGLTLTAGTVVIFLDEPWTNAAKEQAVDRCHRIGTSENITVYTLMAKNTIDERIHQLVLEKGEMSDALVDGKIAQNKAEVVDFLLS